MKKTPQIVPKTEEGKMLELIIPALAVTVAVGYLIEEV
jgi:hypothetical protein